ncbi:MAG: sulfite exporter TauE/SafE family protein [Dehalococcoidia bacterium]|nr:sulfite exporter TauE/SafE family protein [Dehalococcoidia bacterium]
MSKRIAGYLLAGAGTGILAGFLGVGGGVVLIPIMVSLLAVSQHKAHGTSLLIIIPVALAGALTYSLRGDINWVLVATVGPASILGAVIGARSMMKVEPRRLRQLFGVYVIAVAVVIFVR